MIEIILGIVCLLALLDSGIFLSKKDIAERKRNKNAKKGIIMRPNFKYIDPDGTIHISKTGREKDCVCGGIHSSHKRN